MIGLGLSAGLARPATVPGGSAPPAPLPFAAGEAGFWYDPSDFASMRIARDGSGPAPVIGDVVGWIADRSGNGHHAAAPSDAARPRLELVGGRPALRFDGVDDVMVIPTLTYGPELSIFAGFRRESDGVLLGATIGGQAKFHQTLYVRPDLATRFGLSGGGYPTTRVTPTGDVLKATVLYDAATCTLSQAGGASAVTALPSSPSVMTGSLMLGDETDTVTSPIGAALFGLVFYTEEKVDPARMAVAEAWIDQKTEIAP